jgi:hypothetical protein
VSPQHGGSSHMSVCVVQALDTLFSSIEKRREGKERDRWLTGLAYYGHVHKLDNKFNRLS